MGVPSPNPGAPAPKDTPRVAVESRAVLAAVLGRVLASSTDVGWTSLLVELREKPASIVAPTSYESLTTPDQTFVMTVSGDIELERFDGGVWRRTVRQAGSATLTPGGWVDRIRWRLLAPAAFRTAHVVLPTDVLLEADDEFRRAGLRRGPATNSLKSLWYSDPTVAQVIVSLVRAVRAGTPGLYADSVARFLAAHLLSPHATWADGVHDRRSPGVLTDRRLARALEYMSAHFREAVSLDCLAAEAAVSKYHFARLFRAATGEAPHAYLVRLRLECGQQLLRETDLTVAEVAASCGYATAAHFGQAFARETGLTPTAYRAARRRGTDGNGIGVRPRTYS